MYRVPNYRVVVQTTKHTSMSKIVPLYEVPVLHLISRKKNRPQMLPGVGKSGSATRVGKLKGYRDLFEGQRATEFDRIEDEYARLRAKYPASSEDAAGLFDQVYPTAEAFARAARDYYPEELGDAQVIDMAIVPVRAEDDEDFVEDDTDDDLVKPMSAGFETEGPDISALEALPYVDRDQALELYNAGYIDCAKVAGADPKAIATLLHGVGVTNARKIIAAASENDETEDLAETDAEDWDDTE